MANNFKVEHRGMVHSSFSSVSEAVTAASKLASSTVCGEHIAVRFPDGEIKYRAHGRVVSVWPR